ncbi:SGNH/GDSL hydrolase family protein [Phycicoccus sp. Soil802]|uniref:SGNH/GDSL hydrolase family protein n=1 Tax=Phycicoccus sp. Soil802 TaxID=1736414 RepID=UPI000A7E3764|nr:SGNH/GDSL hydrolase family protein [Phycicoccus sp. Soil802]
MSRHRLPRTVLAGGAALAAAVVALVAVVGVVGWWAPSGSAPEPDHSARAESAATPTRTTTSSASSPRSVVGVGDSVTAGTNCDCAPFVARFAELLGARDGRPATATNLGVPGLTTHSLATQLTQAGPARSVAAADLVVVTIGANDLGPLEDRWEQGGCGPACLAPAVAAMARGLATDLARVKALGGSGQRVEVTTYWNVFEDGDVADRQRGAGFADWSDSVTVAANRAICATTRTFGDTCVDLYAPFLSADGNRNPTPLLSSDGDHPDAAGHALIARALLAATPR